MNDTKKILGKYISSFIFWSIIIGVISFLIEMTIIGQYGLTHPSLVITLIVLIFILTSVIIHMIATKRSIGRSYLSEEQKVTLTKTTRVVLGIIALIVMIVDFIVFVNINKSYIADYENIEISKLQASVAAGENTETDIEKAEQEGKKEINSIVYMSLGTKEITNILVYLGISICVEASIQKVKEEDKKEKTEK